MLLYLRRCIACKIEYSYQASGHHIEGSNYSRSGEYCRDCYVLFEAAKKQVQDSIVVKREKVWIDTEEVTYDELRAEQMRQFQSAKAAGKLMGCRGLQSTLYTADAPEWLFTYFFNKNNCQFKVIVDEKIKKVKSIQVAKERDLTTGQMLGYWRVFK